MPEKTETESNEPEEVQYTIDELSAMTGIPSRTIRFYQAKCAFPPPKKKGRKAFYGPHHIERLRLIGELQDRGLQIRAIRTLINELAEGKRSLQEWLGLGDQLRKPWTEDVARLFSESELRDMLKGHRSGLLAALVRAGTVEQQAHQYLVRSPALLRMALELDAFGVDTEVAHGATEILDRHLSRAAADLSRYFIDGIGKEVAEERDAEGVAEFLERVKPIALDAVRVIFAHKIEGKLKEMLNEGKVLVSSKRKDSKKGNSK